MSERMRAILALLSVFFGACTMDATELGEEDTDGLEAGRLAQVGEQRHVPFAPVAEVEVGPHHHDPGPQEPGVVAFPATASRRSSPKPGPAGSLTGGRSSRVGQPSVRSRSRRQARQLRGEML